jgi:hypothetical protein
MCIILHYLNWYITTWYIKILKKKIEYDIFNWSNVLHNALLRYFIVQLLIHNKLIHLHFNIDNPNWLFNLHGNLKKIWKKNYKLNNLKEKKVHGCSIKMLIMNG